MGTRQLLYILTAIIVAAMTVLAALKLPVPASAAPNQGAGYWTDSFTDSTGISTSTNISVSGGDVKLTLGSRTSTYNYVGVTVAGGPHDAYDCDVDDWQSSPAANLGGGDGLNLNVKTEALLTEYQQISSSNNVRWSTTNPGSGDEVFLWCNMSISESRIAVTNISLLYEGFSNDGGSTGRMWIYNNSAGNWEILGPDASFGSGTDGTMNRWQNTNCANYINSAGILQWGVSLSRSNSRMNIDYVQAVVTYNYYSTPGSLNSVSITPSSLQNWGQFNASHDLPSGTGITYKILNAANDSVLCTITAAQAAAGYNISSCAGAASSIKLRAEFSTSNISQTPILYDWGVTWVPVSLTTSAGLYEANRATSATAITPQSEYAIKVRVTDGATLNNLSTVKVTLYYDSDGAYSPLEVPASGNTQTCAILTCTVGATPSWTISPGDSTSWALVLANCTQPGLSGTGGDFWFHFKAGKVATQTTGSARWHIYANVSTTAGFTVSNYQANLNMNWYGEIQMNTAGVDWGLVSAGLDFADSDPSRKTNISVTYISNGAYSQQVKSSTTWAGVSSNAILKPEGNPGPNQFSLRADYDNTLNGSVLVPALYTTFRSGTQTGESGNTESANSLWLKLGTPFQSDQYNGSISYRIAP